MTPTPLEQRIRDLADSGRGDGRMPAEILDRLRRHRRRRQLLAGAAVPAAAAAVAVGVLVPADVLHTSSGTTHPQALGHEHPAIPSAHPSAPPSPAHFSQLPVAGVPADGGEPKTVLVALGAGGERLARVSTATGAVTKWLQTSGSQMLMTFNAEDSTAYQPDLAGCGATWTAINTATGASSPALSSLGHPLEIAIASDNTRIAYVDVGRQERVPDGRGGTMPAGCPTAPHSLVVSDPATGTTATYPIANDDESLYPAFDATGTQLAFVWHRRVRILDLNHDTNLNNARPLTPDLRAGCTQNKPLWRPGSSTVLVAEQCGQNSAIVGYDSRTGDQTYRHPVSGPAVIGSFAVDSSGKHVVYSVTRLDGPGSSVYAIEPGGDRHIVDDGYQVAW